MVRRHHPQRSVFEMILPDGEQLWDPELRRIDEVLEDEVLTDEVEEALRRRRPKSRLLEGDTHYPGKVLSVFETHTETIRKGKKVKPTEFGKLVKVQEAESQFITGYQVCAEWVPDGELWQPSLERHQELFGRPPRLATADAGFGSAVNEARAQEAGIQRVALPAHGRLSPRRRAYQKQR